MDPKQVPEGEWNMISKNGTGVELIWENKNKVLRATRNGSYAWIGDEDAANLERPGIEPVDGTEMPDRHDSLVVTGDGLDALQALEGTRFMADGIRLVYIDPPFNTGKTFNQYGDRMATPMWLSMIKDRIAALVPMLSEYASIWVHLDDSEIHYTRCVMEEILGADSFVTSVIWQKRTTRESRSVFSVNHDTILVFAPAGAKTWKSHRNLLDRDETDFSNPDGDPRGPWRDAPFTAPGYRSGQQYTIVNPAGMELTPPKGRSWYATRETYDRLKAENRIWFPKNGAGSPRLKLFPEQVKGLVPFTIWLASEVGTTDKAKKHLLKLFPGEEPFDTPKPEELLARIIGIGSDPGELVIDIFAGSGTTAAVAQKMGRRWLAVERNPDTVGRYILPRLDKVVDGTDQGGVSRKFRWTGGGDYRKATVRPVTD